MEEAVEACQHGENCYRRNPHHLRNKRHKHLEDALKLLAKGLKIEDIFPDHEGDALHLLKVQLDILNPSTKPPPEYSEPPPGTSSNSSPPLTASPNVAALPPSSVDKKAKSDDISTVSHLNLGPGENYGTGKTEPDKKVNHQESSNERMRMPLIPKPLLVQSPVKGQTDTKASRKVEPTLKANQDARSKSVATKIDPVQDTSKNKLDLNPVLKLNTISDDDALSLPPYPPGSPSTSDVKAATKPTLDPEDKAPRAKKMGIVEDQATRPTIDSTSIGKVHAIELDPKQPKSGPDIIKSEEEASATKPEPKKTVPSPKKLKVATRPTDIEMPKDTAVKDSSEASSLIVPTNLRSVKNVSEKGIVLSLDMAKNVGMIRRVPYSEQPDVEFDLDEIGNNTREPITVMPGCLVSFKTDPHNNVTLVLVDAMSKTINPIPGTEEEPIFQKMEPKDGNNVQQNIVSQTPTFEQKKRLMEHGLKGTLKVFKPNGFGFIRSQGLLGKDAFIHISKLYTSSGPVFPQAGQSVTFILDPPKTENKTSAQLACIEASSVKLDDFISTEKATGPPPSNPLQDENVVQRKMTSEQRALIKAHGIKGVITAYYPANRHGFVKVTQAMPKGYTKKGVLFSVNQLFTNSTPVTPDSGQKMTFVLKKDSQEDPKVDFGCLETFGDKAVPVQGTNTRLVTLKLPTGTVAKIVEDKNFAFVTPNGGGKDHFMYLNKISEYSLPLKVGDVIKFKASEMNGKTSIYKAQMETFTPRSGQEMTTYFKRIHAGVQTPKAYSLTLELSKLRTLWLYCGSHGKGDPDFGSYAKEFLKMITEFLKEKSPSVDPEEPLSCVFKDTDFVKRLVEGSRTSRLKFNLGVVFEPFCKQIILFAPKFAPDLFPLIEADSRKNVESLLFFTIIRQISESLQGGWKSLPEAITEEELARNDLIAGDPNLLPVKKDSPYDSVQEYMDTYFRLLRAEAFYGIQRGIAQFRGGELDLRDMNVYIDITLVAIDLQRLRMVLSFTPLKKVKNWEKSKGLMGGNLLCVCSDNQFKNVVWFTVADRDIDMLNKYSQVIVELCSFNTLTMAEILTSLHGGGGKSIMVESPTYFKAISPSLNTLRDINLETFGLSDAIVYAKPPTRSPRWNLEVEESHFESDGDDESDYDTYSNGSDYNSNFDGLESDSQDDFELGMNNSEVISQFVEKAKLTMDSAQKAAFEHAFCSPLAIIQGPPGTGKTFIGTKLMETILLSKPSSPILVLTYKNHALDEFLKHCLKFCTLDDIVRVGGRSKAEELDECNLTQLLQSQKVFLSKDLIEIRKEVESTLTSLTSEIADHFALVLDNVAVNAWTMLSKMTVDQLSSLVKDAPWGKGPDKIEFSTQKNQCANGTWVTQKMDLALVGGQSFQELLQEAEGSKAKMDSEKILAIDLLIHAAKAWMPPLDKLKELKTLQSNFTNFTAIQPEEDEFDDPNEDDEEQLKELRESRLSENADKRGGQSNRYTFWPLPLTPGGAEDIFTIQDFPLQAKSHSKVHVSNMWELNTIQRYQFLYSLVQDKFELASENLNEKVQEIQSALNKIEEIRSLKKVEILSGRKIIGMTVSGASINSAILQQVRPKIIVVEEAAEVLEPQLIAAMNKDVDHLILIGDHKQLRPSVESYPLVKKYGFNMSLMERLINCGFPYKALQVQNRMRPEFAEMLLDIYPNLETNLERVSKNHPLACLRDSMFFWTHTHMESPTTGSKTNALEAEMVTALVAFFMSNGIAASRITILAPYLGQTKLIRSLLPDTLTQVLSSQPERPSVQTIDMFQGDENDFIIVSLVRSNPRGNIGFLDSLNRRCVAQSRAKCGLYFIGNESTLLQTSGIWTKLVNHMKTSGCLGPKITVQCPKHGKLSQKSVESGTEMIDIVKDSRIVCNLQCKDLFLCQKLEHACRKACVPKHRHELCMTEVDDFFSKCGHAVKRKCHESLTKIQCETKVPITLQPCGHKINKKCYVEQKLLVCQLVIKFVHPNCKHQAPKICHKPADPCVEEVKKLLPCGHDMKVKCHVDPSLVKCIHPCPKMMDCQLHGCKKECGEAHSHGGCGEKVQYRFPTCGHPSPKSKGCTQLISWECDFKVDFIANCSHKLSRKCHQVEKDIPCDWPCSKTRACGHQCLDKCFRDCKAKECLECQKTNKAYKEQALKKVKELKEKIKKSPHATFQIVPLSPSDPQYYQVQDQVTKYVQSMHNWSPTITHVELVINYEREMAFEVFRANGFKDYSALKFHGTTDAGVKDIPKNGFREPDPNPANGKRGMYGQGIYFATDSSKSAQNIYTGGSNKLLLCNVFLGHALTLKTSDNTMDYSKLRRMKCDSVFAPRGSAVKNDEFVVYSKDQAFVKYIIHFVPGGLPIQSLATPTTMIRRRIDPSRTVNFTNQDDYYFRIAESTFYRGSSGSNYACNGKTIAHVEYVANPALEAKYQAKIKEFKSRSIPTDEIFAFHGTQPGSIDSILNTNLSISYAARQVHGRGNYFSEFPGVSLGYGTGLLLFKVLPGNEYVGAAKFWPNHQSKAVQKENDGYGQMIIVEDADQFVPLFVYHLK